MPAIWDRAFSEGFYVRWGRENAVISAVTRRAEYPDYTQLLSIKMMSGGTEDYLVDGRRISVDDDTYLILNAGRCYGSCINALQPGRSFSIFFRAGLAHAVQDALSRSMDALLEDPATDRTASVEFHEQLREHDASVTPVLRYIQRVVDDGMGSEEWLEEQLHFLLARMLKVEREHRLTEQLIPSCRSATRRELRRRLGLAADFIHTHYRSPIDLAAIARAAHLSPFHLLRTFKTTYGVTPSAYLRQKRVNAAVRLIRDSTWTLTEIAEQVGFGCRTTLFRQLSATRSAGNVDLESLATREKLGEFQ